MNTPVVSSLAKPGSGTAITGASEPLRLQLQVDAGTPWPALKVTAKADTPNGVIPALALRWDSGKLRHESQAFAADPMDALLLRSLLQQPRQNEAVFLIGARDFASMLALLRQHSPLCDYNESDRVERVEILSLPPEPMLEFVPAPSPAVEVPNVLRLCVRVRYRSEEGDQELSAPVFRGPTYWTFEQHVAPAPEIPVDPLLKKMLLGEIEPGTVYSGDEALDLICRARQAAGETLRVRVDDRLHLPRVSAQPLKRRTRVTVDREGSVHVLDEVLAPDGTAIPAAIFAEALQKEESQGRAWIEYQGRALRLPEPVAHFRLPSERTLRDDALADFLMGELPKLQTEGAQIDAAVKRLSVASEIKPCVALELTDRESKDVHAQWYFEAPSSASSDGGERESIAPVEILAAAAAGKRYLRRGDTFVKVDREAVMRCRKQLEQALPLDGASEVDAHGEQVPELLAWAQQAGASPDSPWNIYVTDGLDGAHKIKDAPATVRFNVDAEEEEGETWFTLSAEFDHSGKKLSEEELRQMVKDGRRWFLDENDTWVKVDSAALEKFELSVEKSGVSRRRGRRKQLYYRFKPASRERVTDIFSLSGTMQHAERYKKFLEQLRGFDKIQALPVPKGMTLSLREYQQQGFEWMAFLAKYDLNGILADDMGLGKTAQTIAVLTRNYEEFGRQVSLIVTPTSLVDNWRNEFVKFSPGMKVLAYRGSPQRRDILRQELMDYDVVLATYATVRNDASLLRQINWRYIVVDEAHFIKNSAAATTKAIKTIPARHRLALTGTPIQNRLTELWSLFDFLMPDFLGRQMRFRETFEDPIARVQSGRAETKDEWEQGEHAMELLRERIKPFVLRRLKTDVASELPPKIENDVFCALTPEQVGLYKSFADSAEAKEAVSELMRKGVDGACTAILAALMSLRKICNHPDLMCLPVNEGRQHIREPQPGYETRAGKLEALGELLEQCREGGHRALIFCQLTTMLDILAHYLTKNGMKYLRIDGETPGTSRQGLVEKFNADSSIAAFLISTRAGGAGLNLTGADTVIFYDHDWNPANDQQAQDRAYRIGQMKTVNVYRLVCKGTLEEKILKRQALKKALANSIVTHDLSGFKDLSREELLGLFTYEEAAKVEPEKDE